MYRSMIVFISYILMCISMLSIDSILIKVLAVMLLVMFLRSSLTNAGIYIQASEIDYKLKYFRMFISIVFIILNYKYDLNYSYIAVGFFYGLSNVAKADLYAYISNISSIKEDDNDG